ncbi:unnamed protein product [Oppiella nova]|uniref:Uncharacterized protein n=1 Tax=Oppiella nova TaxID=334625 RepID=A0A7R9MSC8_9ACAR|nr:unnamed protein product [Oppiella nova]CAG2182419.1 unnamed protein product [Oppiella nova]
MSCQTLEVLPNHPKVISIYSPETRIHTTRSTRNIKRSPNPVTNINANAGTRALKTRERPLIPVVRRLGV